MRPLFFNVVCWRPMRTGYFLSPYILKPSSNSTMKNHVLFLLLLCSLQAQAQWNAFTPAIPDTVGLWDIDIVDETTAWATAIKWTVSSGGYGVPGYDKGYFFKTTDGGQSWSSGVVSPFAASPYFSNISALSASEAWVAGTDNNTYESFVEHTTDGGATWVRKLQDGFGYPSSYVDFVHFWDPQHGMAMGDPATDANGGDVYFEIYLTSDGGENWTRVPKDNFSPNAPSAGDYGLVDFFQVSGNSVWFGTAMGSLYYSNNAGESWGDLAPANPPYNISFVDEIFGVMSSSDSLYFTADAGHTWTAGTLPPFAFALTSLAVIPNSHYILATTMDDPINGPFKTLLSKDKGMTWQVIGEGENACKAEFISETVGFAGEWQPVDHATKLYRYAGNPLSGILSGRPLEAEVNIFPNPTSDFVVVDARTAQSADFILLVNDEQGRLVKRLVFEKTNSLTTSLDLRSAPAGIYTLTVSTKDGMVAKQVVKQ